MFVQTCLKAIVKRKLVNTCETTKLLIPFLIVSHQLSRIIAQSISIAIVIGKALKISADFTPMTYIILFHFVLNKHKQVNNLIIGPQVSSVIRKSTRYVQPRNIYAYIACVSFRVNKIKASRQF